MPYAADGVISQDPLPYGVEITEGQYSEALDGMMAGLVVTIGDGFKIAPAQIPEPAPPTEDVLSAMRADQEAMWRAAEMPLAQECVTALSFGDNSIPGTVTQWKAYWLALRDWKEGAEHYPDSSYRPIRPT